MTTNIKEAKGVRIGQIYKHWGGAVYEVTGFYKMSDSSVLDHQLIVAYRNHATKEDYVTPLDRFLGTINTPRFELQP